MERESFLQKVKDYQHQIKKIDAELEYLQQQKVTNLYRIHKEEERINLIRELDKMMGYTKEV